MEDLSVRTEAERERVYDPRIFEGKEQICPPLFFSHLASDISFISFNIFFKHLKQALLNNLSFSSFFSFTQVLAKDEIVSWLILIRVDCLLASNLSIRDSIIPMKDKHLKKRLKTMVELDKDGAMSVEDVAWLCSLSESEIDMLISLKFLIIQRAKMIGYANLANKFNLKMIRVIACVLMELLKEEVKDSSLVPDMVKSAAFLESCNLLKCDNEVAATIEELGTNIGADIQTLLSSPPTSKRRRKEGRKQRINDLGVGGSEIPNV